MCNVSKDRILDSKMAGAQSNKEACIFNVGLHDNTRIRG